MIQLCFTVWDRKAECAVTPFFSQNEAVALRDFRSACNTEEHAFFRNPEDYSLWYVGSFNQEDRKLVDGDTRMVAEAFNLKEDK